MMRRRVGGCSVPAVAKDNESGNETDRKVRAKLSLESKRCCCQIGAYHSWRRLESERLSERASERGVREEDSIPDKILSTHTRAHPCISLSSHLMAG